VCATIAAAIALIVILFFAQDLKVQDEEDEHGREGATADRDRNSFGDARDPRRAGPLLH
jgi:hypothetical protein